MQVLLTTCGAWYLRNTARAFEQRGALAAIWCTEKNITGVAPERFRRSWPFHLLMMPLYLYAPQIWIERAFYRFFPVWRAWQNRQPWPKCDVVHSITSFATEPFDHAEKIGALKVLDCPNSHPTTLYGFWQRECDIWCPGEQVPLPRRFFARMNREIERADVLICPSNFVRDTMVQNGVPAGKCFVNPFGVDTSVFTPRSELPPKPRFICVGTICVRKGHQYLFRAFELVKKQRPDAELVCVGQYKTDFRKERSKWEGTFEHHPSLSHPEVAGLLRNSTAFVLASVEEGLARVISEASAAALPVIATYESGATTLVDNDVQGIIVPSRNPQQLASAMLRLAADPRLCQQMGKAALARGAASNTWQDYGDRLLKCYEAFLAVRR